MKPFRDLKVWQKAHEATLEVYKLTEAFPQNELYGLTSQMRRAAVSIGANIAEGCGRGGDTEFGRYCQMAMGSASELEYHLLLGKDLQLVVLDDYCALNEKVIEIKKMLTSLIRKLQDDRRLQNADR